MYTFDVPVPSAVLAVWGEGSLGDGGTGTGVGLAGDVAAAGGGWYLVDLYSIPSI